MAAGGVGTMASNPLIGTWSLVDGRVSYPLGEDAVGKSMYGQDGYMSVAIMGPERTMFAAGDLLSGSLLRPLRVPGRHGRASCGTQPGGYRKVRAVGSSLT